MRTCIFLFKSSMFIAFIFFTIGISHLFFATEEHPLLADRLDHDARLLKRPHWWWREQAERLYRPYMPGRYGQKNSIANEVVARSALTAFLLPSGFITYSLNKMGSIPYYLSLRLKKTPYTKYQGGLPEKMHQQQEGFSLLSWNITFLPGELASLYGGVRKPIERVDEIASFIINSNADVVCLYEAHDRSAVFSLFRALKKHYAHFYFDIQPSLCIHNSGLFIASKFKIADIDTCAFDLEGRQEGIKKGFFSFSLKDTNGVFGRIAATHLQPYKGQDDEKIRQQELTIVTQSLAPYEKEESAYPIILCGDLNIAWGSDEYKHSSLQSNFEDAYTQNLAGIDETSRTATDYFTDDRWDALAENPHDPQKTPSYFEILDYIVLSKKSAKKWLIDTRRLKAFETDKPERALSDHHALYAKIKSKAR